MKKITTLLVFSIFGYTLTAQTVRRVNGDPAITGVNVYNSIQAAVDAANTDDIILIEPYGENESLNPYYDEANNSQPNQVHVDKRLHFRGNGYNLDNSSLNITSLDKRSVYTSCTIYLDLGSSGSTIKNLRLGNVEISSDNVVIESCLADHIRFTSLENINSVISQGINSVIRKSLLFYGIDDYRGTLSKESTELNCTIENSHFGQFASIGDLDNSVIKNCYISQLYSTDNSVFTNCIFQSKIVGNAGGGNFNNAISYCISFENDLPTLGNNQNNIAWQQVFKGSNYGDRPDAFPVENDSELSNSSVAKNAGINGGDIGIYGGTYPYEKSGLPHHPISTFFINSGIGNNDIDIDAVITIKAN
ncbi:hypothetical protein LAG90_04980 [Marinilongibacter aquaticus]|uniref:hypothetical protein n=1 Tax=Marinilongibacter aquaticus TaxID=2975157 RepID=UPI0021BD629E|nr:hypothetical protein [Marinilongibacter aquaticus]UBM60002.1 hypothetical protein LAG90_04980 [Marinilongibacter aquaticus]